jgi:DNA relaxase NicK
MISGTYLESYRKKSSKCSLTLRHRIELPIRLPTWNDLLGMNRWARRHVRRLIHAIIFTSIPGVREDVIGKLSLTRPQLTDLFVREYYATIQTRSSKISPQARALIELIVPQ